MKNILITGGAGFIGSNLALKLLDKGYEVTVLDILSPQIHGEDPEHTSPLYQSIKDKVNFIKGSVTNREIVSYALQGQECVVHFAAETGTGQSMYEIEHYVNVNSLGTAILLDVLTNEKHTVKKVVVASSRAIYGEGRYLCCRCGIVYPIARKDKDMKVGDFDCKCPQCGNHVELVATTEDSLSHPTSVYGIAKQNQEQMVLTVCPAIGIAGVALRYQNVYGPGQSLSNPYTGILSIFSTQIKNKNRINIFEDGKESRDFVFIDDVVNATILSIEKKEANNQIFNVGTGVATNVISVTKELMNNYDIQVPVIVSGNYRLGDIRHNYADLTKARTLLAFEPQVTFSTGIKRFTDWVNHQNIQEDKYAQSILEMKKRGLYK